MFKRVTDRQNRASYGSSGETRHGGASAASLDGSLPTVEQFTGAGVGVARGARYALCIAAGYMFGMFAGQQLDGPPLVISAAVGLVALYLVFRRGRASVATAAAEAVSQANARANAAAIASTNVNVAGGHIVTNSAAERDIWDDYRNVGPVQAYELGSDAVTGATLYEVRGRVVREDQLSELERANVVPAQAHARRNGER